MEYGATRRSPRIASCAFRCSRISSPRERSRAPTTCIARRTASASGRCSSSTARASSAGATYRRSASIPAPTGFSRRSRAWKRRSHELEAAGRPAGSRARQPGCAHRAGRVRRLRMPVLRAGLLFREGPPGSARRRLALRLPQLPARPGAPARAAGRAGRRGRGAAGPLLGDARRPVRAPGHARPAESVRFRRRARARHGALRARFRLARGGGEDPGGLPLRRPQRRERNAHVLRQRRALRRLLGPAGLHRRAQQPGRRCGGAALIPKLMRAAALDRFGGPEVLTLHRLPVPVPDAGEILIAVHTAGVGSWDADVREGWNPGTRRPFPIVLGYDGSGTVAAAGKAVRRLRVGDRVYSYNWDNPKGGFYAEYVAVPAAKAAHTPRRLDLREAGAIPITGLTALQGVERLGLRKGSALAIHGASGGVGTIAVQFARLRKARVFPPPRGRTESRSS